MLNMSFYNGTLNRNELRDFIKTTIKPIKYTIGFAYKKPTTLRVLISKDEALKIIEAKNLLDATEFPDYLHLNSFNENDMW